MKTEILDKGANSSLLIAKINKLDSGNYSCFINATHEYTVSVHVLNGKPIWFQMQHLLIFLHIAPYRCRMHMYHFVVYSEVFSSGCFALFHLSTRHTHYNGRYPLFNCENKNKFRSFSSVFAQRWNEETTSSSIVVVFITTGTTNKM